MNYFQQKVPYVRWQENEEYTIRVEVQNCQSAAPKIANLVTHGGSQAAGKLSLSSSSISSLVTRMGQQTQAGSRPDPAVGLVGPLFFRSLSS
jgi:hypothetical protein